MSSESAKTFGFMMRPAVFSGYSSSSPTSPPAGRFWNSSSTAVDKLLGQVIDDRRRVVGRQLLEEFDYVFGRAVREERRAGLRAELRQRFHRQTAVPFGEDREGGVPVFVGKLREDLCEIGRMLLLKQIDKVRRRAHPEQAFHGVEDDV